MMFDLQCVCMARAMLLGLFVNPWRTYMSRVAVLGSVCLLSHISPMECLFNLKMLSSTQRATKIKNVVGFCLKRFCSRVMPQNTSEEANFQLTCGQISPIDQQRSDGIAMPHLPLGVAKSHTCALVLLCSGK